MLGRGRDAPATAGAVATAVVAQVWALLVLLGALALAGVAWWGTTGDPVPARMAAQLAAVAVIGLVGSFVLHEVAHLAVLRRIATVLEVRLERTRGRVSLHPRGTMAPHQVAGVAVAGPAACALAGLVLWVAVPGSMLHWWYLAHVMALVPPLGDGRAVVTAVRAARPSAPPTTRRP